MKRLYSLYSVLLLLLFLCAACNKMLKSTSDTEKSRYDSDAKLTNAYQGYRLELVNLEVFKGKIISGTLINTGKYKVQLPPKSNQPLVIQFDESLSNQGFSSYEHPLQQKILQQTLSLEPGQIYSNFKVNLGETVQASSEGVLASKSGDFQDFCPDLKIDTFFVSKRKKKYAEITFKIVNVGKGSAELYGQTDVLEDNVAIRAYASGTENLSRGDLVLGGAFIEKEVKQQQGILPPLASFGGSFKIDIRKKTRHMPYLIISIDDYQILWECEERNNVKKLLYR